MLDGQFDFPFKARLCEALFRPGGRLDSFSSWLRDNQGYYGQGAIMTTWIGNHDIPRAIHFASGQIENCRAGSSPQNGWNPSSYTQPTQAAPYERLGLAFAVMMTTNAGIPLIYYGDEVGLAGGGDPDNRRMMPWDDSELNAHQKELRSTVKKLARMRAKHPALARGQRRTLSAGQDTWMWEMSGCGAEPIVVAVNRADSPNSVQIPAGSYTNLRDESSTSGGMMSIPARDFMVLQAAGN
jgi:glycosidase